MSASNSSLDSSLISTKICVTAMIVFQEVRIILLLPLFIYILLLAFRQWRSQSSASVTSHSDVITYHQAVMVLMFSLGWMLIMVGFYIDVNSVMMAGNFLAYFMFYGETLLHILTCAERYLAVLHPVTYRGLKSTRGVWLRNIFIGCCWLLSMIWSIVTNFFSSLMSSTPMLSIVVLAFIAISFFSVSVLFVLIRPGPGEGGRNKEHVDQTKQRVFKTIMTITGVLWVGILGNLIPLIGFEFFKQNYVTVCISQIIGFCFNVPSNLVLPVLYLHRAGKLACCCANCVKTKTVTETRLETLQENCVDYEKTLKTLNTEKTLNIV